MSWLEAPPRAGRLAAVLVAMLALGGCVVHPLYGPASVAGGASVQAEIEAIAVDPIPDRIGHYLGNELIFLLNGTGDVVAPRYRLHVAPTENVQTALIDTLQSRATAASVIVTASYTLLPAAGGQAIVSGSVTTIADYDRSVQRFANVRAARDAEIRAAKSLADMIKTQVAAALASRT